MQIVSYNVNGIRAALKKGLIDWLQTNPCDMLCLQEVKALIENIDPNIFTQLGYKLFWYPAVKKGYSGVAVFSKIEPVKVTYGNGYEQSDFEGRVIRLDFEKFTLINAYFPSGTSGAERQTYKYQWLDEFFTYLQQLKNEGKSLIVTGDYNICHQAIDIHDPKGNKNTSGFLPEERAWMDKLFNNGFIDTFRYFHPEQTGAYTWWSQRFPSVRLNNKGWRIDYISVTEDLKPLLQNVAIHPDAKHSDHCPISLSINIP